VRNGTLLQTSLWAVKKRKVANHGKGGVATTHWVDHWFGSCSLTF